MKDIVKEHPWLTQLIIQPVMIILSITAALGVDNWQKSRAKVSRVADTKAAFVKEITANKQLLLSENYLPFHRKLQAQYAEAMKNNAPDPGTFFESGPHPAPLRDSAWRVVSGTFALMELPSGFVLALTDIYRLQDSLEKHNQGFLNVLDLPRSDRETPAYTKDLTRSISLFLNELVPTEERLIRNYDHVLDRFAADKPPWADEIATK